MAKMLVTYYSQTGNTKHMAEAIAEAAGKIAGVNVDLKPIDKVQAENLAHYDAIVIGSPTYYGTMAADVKNGSELIQNSPVEARRCFSMSRPASCSVASAAATFAR